MYKIYIFMQCAPKSFGRFSGLRADVEIGPISADFDTAYRPPNMAGVMTGTSIYSYSIILRLTVPASSVQDETRRQKE